MLKIGVPSKGRLMEKTFDWFGARGVTMRQTGAEREYSGAVDGVEGVELVMLSAGEIPRELSAGRIHLGVTGSDLVRDKLADWQMQVAELAPLGFGHADLIIAVPSCWIDVDSLDDLDAAAQEAQVALLQPGHLPALERHRAARRVRQTGDLLGERRLTGAGRADHRGQSAGAGIQRDVVQQGLVALDGPRQAADLQTMLARLRFMPPSSFPS